MSHVIPAIKENDGFIDKYIGDAVIALFPESAEDAVRASVEILKNIQTFNQARELRNKKPISVGTGLHTGSLMIGTIGNRDCMDGTVISDAVNLTERIGSLILKGRLGRSWDGTEKMDTH